MRAADGGFWYNDERKLLRGWRRGTEQEVEEYLRKTTLKYNKRNGTAAHSWRAITKARGGFRFGKERSDTKGSEKTCRSLSGAARKGTDKPDCN